MLALLQICRLAFSMVPCMLIYTICICSSICHACALLPWPLSRCTERAESRTQKLVPTRGRGTQKLVMASRTNRLVAISMDRRGGPCNRRCFSRNEPLFPCETKRREPVAVDKTVTGDVCLKSQTEAPQDRYCNVRNCVNNSPLFSNTSVLPLLTHPEYFSFTYGCVWI